MKYNFFFLTIFIMMLISVFTAGGEEEMAVSEGFKEYVIKVCPAFKNAKGRKREQLAALFQLAGKIQDKDRREKVRRLFDLSDKEDSKLLEQLLLETEEPLAVRERLGLEVIFLAHGPRSVPWLLERYPNAKPLAKAAIIIILSRLEFKEVYEFMIDKLEDKTEVPNEIAQILSPYPDRYHHYRICDYAYTTLYNNIGYRDKLISLPDIDHHESFDQRNRKKANLSTWLSDPNNTKWSEFLSKKPSALSQIKDAGEREKFKAILKAKFEGINTVDEGINTVDSEKPVAVTAKPRAKQAPLWAWPSFLIGLVAGMSVVGFILLLKKKARSRRL